MVVPEQKEAIIEKAREEEREIIEHYDEGLISRDERRRMIVEIWLRAKVRN